MSAKSNRRAPENVEITFERAQVTTLIVGSVATLGVVFLLGVAFGRHLTVPGAEPEQLVVAEAEATPEEAPTLSFHSILTEETVEASPAKPEPKPAAKKPAPEAEVARAEPKPEPKPEPVAEPKPEAAVAEAKPAPKPAPKAEPASAADRLWAVQVASSQDREDTDKLAGKLKDAGYAARVVAADIPGRGTWYRVRVGQYENREDASMKQAEIKVAMAMSGIVVPD